MKRFLLALWLGIPAIANAPAIAGATRGNPEIVTSGLGTISLKPDRATVTIAVVTRAQSAAEAGRQNTARMRPVISALRRQGLPDSAVTTTGYSVYLERNTSDVRSANAAPTYIARNAVSVIVADLDALGGLVDTALVAGATEIANITFASTLEAAAQHRAIAEAVRAGRADAEAAATAAGGTLGDLIELSLVPMYGTAFAVMGGMSAVDYGAASSPVMPRNVTVRSQARLRFTFVPRP